MKAKWSGLKRPKTNKYRAVQETVDGIRMASQKEARRYKELKGLEIVNVIHDLECQKRFLLQNGFYKGKKYIRPIYYVADFVYTDEHGETIVEDVKGMRTQVYKLKKKLFEYRYHDLTIKEV